MVQKNWPFEVAPNTGCITTRQVMELGYPVLAVLHDDDGAWQVLCDMTENPADGMLVGLDCLFERFPELAQHASLQRGYEAVRASADSPWVVRKTVYE
jgi:hypothetical protein